MKKYLYVDKVISCTPYGDRVGVYVLEDGKEHLLAEMHPTKARKIQLMWNSTER